MRWRKTPLSPHYTPLSNAYLLYEEREEYALAQKPSFPSLYSAVECLSTV